MNGNEKSLGRNFYTADTAVMVSFADCFRWELRWDDGAFVYGIEDSKNDAIKALNRYGFSHN
jgi:hypothetical protein